MPNNLTLAPLEPHADKPREGYARLTRTTLAVLVRAMPDAQSAILAVLTWHAVRNTRLKLGPLAGRAAAGVSGEQLVEYTGRPLRTIRHALARLVATGAVVKEPVPAGRKNNYALPWLTTVATQASSQVTASEGGPYQWTKSA